MNRRDFKDLSAIRLKEANALLKNKNYSGAYYLAGYAIECALKACISKETRRYDFPDKQRALDSWQHSLTKLVQAAHLQTALDREMSSEKRFEANWNVVKDWSELSRYSQTDQRKAEALIEAIFR